MLQLQLNPELEKQLLHVVGQKFNGSFESFIKASLEQQQDTNLTPITIQTISKGGLTLQFSPKLCLQPQLDDENPDMMVINEAAFNIYVYETNRRALIKELKAYLFLLWQEYAQEQPENLTHKARQLRETLLQRCSVKETNHAPR